MNEVPLISPVFREIVSSLATEVASKYRVGLERAENLVLEELTTNRNFVEAANSATTSKALLRTRVYKTAATAAKKKIYFSLRRYKSDEATIDNLITRLEKLEPGKSTEEAMELRHQLLLHHISTSERQEHFQALFEAIAPALQDAQTVIDLGAGMFPLTFDFDRFKTVNRYLALDRDPVTTRAVKSWGAWRNDNKLESAIWNVQTDGIHMASNEPFDIGFLFKFIPVVKRQDPKSLDSFLDPPIRQLIVTGSRQGMVKRRDISHRELGVLKTFATDYRWKIISEFETPDEVGLWLSK